MKTSELLQLLPGLQALDCYPTGQVDTKGDAITVPYRFMVKTRFNIAKNLVVVSKVAAQFEAAKQEIRNEIRAKYLDADGKFIAEKVDEANAEMKAALDILGEQENPAGDKLLRLPYADIVCDDQPVPASVIAILLPLLDECPKDQP